MSKRNVLVAGSSANRIEIKGGGTGPTGQYLNVLVVPVAGSRVDTEVSSISLVQEVSQ